MDFVCIFTRWFLVIDGRKKGRTQWLNTEEDCEIGAAVTMHTQDHDRWSCMSFGPQWFISWEPIDGKKNELSWAELSRVKLELLLFLTDASVAWVTCSTYRREGSDHMMDSTWEIIVWPRVLVWKSTPILSIRLLMFVGPSVLPPHFPLFFSDLACWKRWAIGIVRSHRHGLACGGNFEKENEMLQLGRVGCRNDEY